MTLECAVCEGSFEAKNKRARYCGDVCRKRAQRQPKPGANGFERSTRKELERLGKLDSMLGQQALVIAARMGNKGETGSAIATLSREHSRLMAAVAAGATTADPVDEARQSRERKIGGS